MAVRTKTELLALYGSIGSIFPDNTVGAISESDMRNFGQDLADSLIFVAQSPIRGGFNAAGTDVYPAAGTGSGASGAILLGDEFIVTTSGDNTSYGGALPIGTIFKAITNVPGSTASNWRII